MSQAPGESLPTLVSLVIPVWNERDSLVPLHAEIDAISQSLAMPIEVVFVDDGSTDGSWQTLCELQAKDSRVSAIRFRRNFGKAAALSAGFAQAGGDWIFTLDADLQDDPREIPAFLKLMSEEDYGVVSGWKRVRHDPWHKTFPSRVFNGMVSRLTGVRLHDHNCGFKLYRREALDEIQLYGELHRFVPVLAAARGFRIGEIVVQHRARQFGASKYGWSRIARGFLDLLTVKFLTAYQNRPQHLLGGLGLACFFVGAVGLTYLAILWILGYRPIGERPLLPYSVAALLFGFQLMTFGLLAELLTARNLDPRNVYSVAERRLAPPRDGSKT